MLMAVALWFALQGDAEALWNQGKREEAVGVLVAQLERAPGDATLRVKVARAELALHRNVAALEHLAPLGKEVDGLRGTALFRLGEFEKALAVPATDDAAQVLMRIDALESLDRLPESDAELARLAKLVGDEDPRVTTQRGRSLARAGKLAEAAAQFRRTLTHDPCDAAALFGLGTALVKLGSRDEGLSVLAEHRRITPLLDQLDFAERSVDLAPEHASNHAAVGDAERALGRLDRAEASYAQAEKLATVDELAPIALRHARLLSEDRHNVAAAVKLLDSAAVRALDVRLFVRAGDLLAAAQRFDEALKRFESAAKVRPDDAEIERRIASAREHKP
jgi:tetratricopeptide (TPR) repeat protein